MSSIVAKMSGFSVSFAFLLLVGLFIAAALIALLSDLTDKQQNVYEGIFTVGAAVIGAVFGVKIQAPHTKKAERERDRAREERDQAKDHAARERTGHEAEKEKGKRKLSEAQAKVIAAVARASGGSGGAERFNLTGGFEAGPEEVAPPGGPAGSAGLIAAIEDAFGEVDRDA